MAHVIQHIHTCIHYTPYLTQFSPYIIKNYTYTVYNYFITIYIYDGTSITIPQNW